MTGDAGKASDVRFNILGGAKLAWNLKKGRNKFLNGNRFDDRHSL